MVLGKIDVWEKVSSDLSLTSPEHSYIGKIYVNGRCLKLQKIHLWKQEGILNPRKIKTNLTDRGEIIFPNVYQFWKPNRISALCNVKSRHLYWIITRCSSSIPTPYGVIALYSLYIIFWGGGGLEKTG